MTDASFGAAGYALLIEHDPNQKFSSLRKPYAPVGYGSKTFTPAQKKCPFMPRNSLQSTSHLKNLGI